MAASVPELTMRTFSMFDINLQTISASAISSSVGAPKLNPRPIISLTLRMTSG